MADARPFRGLRYGPAKVDPAAVIAPPYDVISPEEQRALYDRSPHNIVRVEYGEHRAGDSVSDNRYTRAAHDLEAWRLEGVLVRDERPAMYRYDQQFTWRGQRYLRTAYFCAVRLEEWEKGVIKPHEHTLSRPKQDRLDLLRATRTQVSPVYSLFRPKAPGPPPPEVRADVLYDFDADGQHHKLTAVTDAYAIDMFRAQLAASDVYIADGHHRYETALAYRNECRGGAASWSGQEPESFVLMALTDVVDPGLLVLPTHRIVSPPSWPSDALARISRYFSIGPFEGPDLPAGRPQETKFGAIGLEPGSMHLLTLRDRAAVEAMMPAAQPEAWKRLDVNVLQYGILQHVFGIDDAALVSGGAVTYTQDALEARDAVDSGRARFAFLLNATPVEQVLAVADAGARMPQKSTYFYPKIPTGLVLNLLDA